MAEGALNADGSASRHDDRGGEPPRSIARVELRVLDAGLAAEIGDDPDACARRAAEWLGDRLDRVMAEGLRALEDRPGMLGRLEADPGLLLGMQALVFVEGRGHWDELAEILAALGPTKAVPPGP